MKGVVNIITKPRLLEMETPPTFDKLLLLM